MAERAAARCCAVTLLGFGSPSFILFAHTGRPLGSEVFIAQIEGHIRRSVRPPRSGPKERS